jgi:hypothetical protein
LKISLTELWISLKEKRQVRNEKNFNAAAMVISEELGFKSLDYYVSDMVRANVRMELEGIGHFEREHIDAQYPFKVF